VEFIFETVGTVGLSW